MVQYGYDHTLLIVRMALFCRVIIFLIVIEFPHTCIPYVRWLCIRAKYRHLSACLERKSLALFIAKIALDILS